MCSLKLEAERSDLSKKRRRLDPLVRCKTSQPSTDLIAILDAVLSLVSSRARARRVRLVCQTAERVRLAAEPLTLFSIIDGLLTNAIVRSPIGGQVTCRISVREGLANIQVSDQGAALQTRDLDRLLWPDAVSLVDEVKDRGLLDWRWVGLVKSFDGSRIEGRSTTDSVAFTLALPLVGCP